MTGAPLPQSTRRHFVAALCGIALGPAALRAFARHTPAGPHPVPRAGISAAKIATNAQLSQRPAAIPTFALAREIPEVLDGIRCQCGCTDGKVYYSLLSCFETPDMMAAECEICQAQARLAHRLHAAGKTLDEIRKGIDAKFG